MSNILEGFAFEDIFTQSVMSMQAPAGMNTTEASGVEVLSSATTTHLPDLEKMYNGQASGLSVSALKSVSSCEMECDVHVEHVLNPILAKRNEEIKASQDHTQHVQHAQNGVKCTDNHPLPPDRKSKATENRAADSDSEVISPPASLQSSSSSSSSSNTPSMVTSLLSQPTDTPSLASSTQHLSCVRSLKELWDEERIRRVVKGKTERVGDVQTPPATQTSHRPLRDTEREYATRLQLLEEKGMELFGVSCSGTSAGASGSVGGDSGSAGGSDLLSSSQAGGSPRALVHAAIMQSQRERQPSQDGGKGRGVSVLAGAGTSGDVDNDIDVHVDHDDDDFIVTHPFSQALNSQYDNILSQYTTTTVGPSMAALSPVSLLETMSQHQHQHQHHTDSLQRQATLQQDIERLSGLIPEEDGEGQDDQDLSGPGGVGGGNEIAWQTQAAQAIVKAIEAVEIDNEDIVQLNRNMDTDDTFFHSEDNKSVDNITRRGIYKHDHPDHKNTTSSHRLEAHSLANPTGDDSADTDALSLLSPFSSELPTLLPNKENKNKNKDKPSKPLRRGVIASRHGQRPPLDGRLGRLLKTTTPTMTPPQPPPPPPHQVYSHLHPYPYPSVSPGNRSRSINTDTDTDTDTDTGTALLVSGSGGSSSTSTTSTDRGVTIETTYGLVDAVDKKRKQEKKLAFKKRQKKVGFSTDPHIDVNLFQTAATREQDGDKRLQMPSAPSCLTPDPTRASRLPRHLLADAPSPFLPSPSSPWASPLPLLPSPPLDTTAVMHRLHSQGLLVLKPSFPPPSSGNISMQDTVDFWDGENNEPSSYLHTIPFYSNLADRDVITGVSNRDRRGIIGRGLRPRNLRHCEDLPSFGDVSRRSTSGCSKPAVSVSGGGGQSEGGYEDEEDVIGTLETCLAVTLPPSSSLRAYRVHTATPRCLVPTFSPPCNAEVIADFQSTLPPSSLKVSHDGETYLTPPVVSNTSEHKTTKIRKVMKRSDQDYTSPRKSQLATPTQTQPKKSLAMKVEKEKPTINKSNNKRKGKQSPSSDEYSDNNTLGGTGDNHRPPAGSAPSLQQAFSRLKTFSLELFATCSGANLPNPKVNSVHCVFYVVNEITSTADSAEECMEYGVVCLLPPSLSEKPVRSGPTPSTGGDSTVTVTATATATSASTSASTSAFLAPVSLTQQPTASHKGHMLVRGANIPPATKIHMVTSEIALFETLIALVRSADPDFLVGYEVQQSSWGYLIDRGRYLIDTTVTPPSAHSMDLLQLLSRVPQDKASSKNEHDVYGQEHDSGIWITGRTILNLWRRMRAELKLTSYTMSSVSSHLLQKSFPEFSAQQLARWFKNGRTLGMVVNYLFRQANMNIVFIDKLDLIRRTAGD